MSTTWNDHETDVLTEAWTAGCTADSISDALGRGRGSIIKRVWMLGLNESHPHSKGKPKLPGFALFAPKASGKPKVRKVRNYKPTPGALAELEELRDRVASDAGIKVGSPQWAAALARCKALRTGVGL